MIFQDTFQAGEDPSKVCMSSAVYLQHSVFRSAGFPLHCHSFYEMEFFMNVAPPRGAYASGISWHTIQEGRLFITPPLHPHANTSLSSRSNLVLQFIPNILSRVISSVSPTQQIVLSESLERDGYLDVIPASDIDLALRRIIEASPHFETPLAHEDQYIQYTVTVEMELIAELLKLLRALIEAGHLLIVEGAPSNQEMNNLQKLLSHLLTHPEERPDMRAAAKVACMGYSAFSRYFKRAVGCCYVDFCNIARIYRARELLVETDLSSGEISERLNFGSVSYFNRIFLKYTRITPSEYRKRTLASKDGGN